MRCGVTVFYYILLRYDYDDVRAALQAAHRLFGAETRAGPCTTCTNTSTREVYCCDDFRRAFHVKLETTT